MSEASMSEAAASAQRQSEASMNAPAASAQRQSEASMDEPSASAPRLSAPAIAPAIAPLPADPLGALIAELTASRKVEAVAAERRRREDDVARTVELILCRELKTEYERDWPDRITIETRTAAFRAFSDWARADTGLGYLPAQATTVAAYLVDRAAAGVGVAELRQTAKAIAWAHEVGQHYLNRAPIAAAISFIARKLSEDRAAHDSSQEA
jgi:hypothetical protein